MYIVVFVGYCWYIVFPAVDRPGRFVPDFSATVVVTVTILMVINVGFNWDRALTF